MNIGRAYAWFLAAWLVFCIPSAIAGVSLAESTFQDWSGEISEIVLPDGSELYQYTSRTFSGAVEGAMLGLSFIPRFHCASTFSVRVRGSDQSAVSEPMMEVLFGDNVLKFAAVANSEEGFVSYSVIASSEQMEDLRQLLDSSSRVTVTVGSASGAASDTQPGAGSPGPVGNRIVFSLLGSKRAALSAESHCLAHEPVAYQPK